MSFMISEALRDAILATSHVKSQLDGLVIHIYGSTVDQSTANSLIPSSADAASSAADLLSTITVDAGATTLSFEATPVNGALVKTATETWRGINSATGFASFYRLEESADTRAADSGEIRCQGTCGELGTDLVIASSSMTSGSEQRIDNYSLTLPLSA